MAPSRRRFITSSALATVGTALGAGRLGAQPQTPARQLPGLQTPTIGKAARPLSILIIGGTGFTGPEQVEYALARGHKVTLLNRNKTRPDLFKGSVDQLIGDLNADVSALKDHSFDAVLDIPTTFPGWVRNVGQYLKGHVKQYVYISTQSVYTDDSAAWKGENDTLATMPAGVDPYDLTPANASKYYGSLKAFSETEVAKTYPGMALIIRPGLIVGPLDRSDRFTYWPSRIDKGGEVLAPGDPTDPVQIIDARDLAEWTIRMIEAREVGIYNACGPAGPLSMAEMLYGIKAVTTSNAQFTWVPADFLREQKVSGWRDMPVWVSPKGRPGFSQRSAAKAVAKGLTFRPLAVTAKDTLDWNKQRPAAEQQALADGTIAGMSAAREAAVLAAWKTKKTTSSSAPGNR
jgi:2'-hydroxyisoflavone reductase